MARLPHLFIPGTAAGVEYRYPGENGRPDLALPTRPARAAHARSLREQFESAVQSKAEMQRQNEPNFDSSFVVLEFRSDPGFDLKLESLDRRTDQFELLNSRIENGVMIATVRISEGKLPRFIVLLEQYEGLRGAVRNLPLMESITEIRLAVLPSFWTDFVNPLPDANQAVWWELWLSGDGTSGVIEAFQSEARRIGIQAGQRVILFPERVVIVARGTSTQLSQMRGLFGYLAELRKAIEVPTSYINLEAKDQADVIEEALQRITPPSESAPAVCILDTGVNNGHPLLALALSSDHTLTVDPEWNSADIDGHGTGMAGLALYGCLTQLFESDEPLTLTHRLESVKIIPDHGANAPENYGAITSEAIALAEIASPTRKRVVCLAITAARCNEGEPSSWSAEIDQIAAGVHDGEPRLVVVAAGNIRDNLQHDHYPGRNRLEGIEDPAQAWNALTVGAYAHKSHIISEEFAGLRHVAEEGLLCPTSRTSMIWQDTDWPLKPDIVLEGGNTAGEPGGFTYFIEDLSLLTTTLDGDGVLLTHFCETSAATAIAARMGAMLQAAYDSKWPETVRGLLVHSAEWTEPMKEEFPHPQRLDRLKCYGYGVPKLQRALWSAGNVVTLIVQDLIQPYKKEGSDYKTNEMHFHPLPWPVQVLQGLGETEISMKVTLSYFIEPSPGRRGWGEKHRYRSFGLRFDVKRPTETAVMFRQRLNRLFWENQEERPDAAEDNRNWELGGMLRSRGSIHSDRWTGTAADLAASGEIAVRPVVGWWRERHHLGRWSSLARYSLIVTIETPDENVDLYTPIAEMIAAEEQAMIDSLAEAEQLVDVSDDE